MTTVLQFDWSMLLSGWLDAVNSQNKFSTLPSSTDVCWQAYCLVYHQVILESIQITLLDFWSSLFSYLKFSLISAKKLSDSQEYFKFVNWSSWNSGRIASSSFSLGHIEYVISKKFQLQLCVKGHRGEKFYPENPNQNTLNRPLNFHNFS